MKIFIAILAVVIIVFLMLGVWFVRWANRPDNVERFRQKKEADTAKKIEGEKKEAELAKDFEAKKANLKLVIDEHFSGNRFEFLDFQYEKINYFSFGENELKFSGIITKGQGAQEYFIYSKEDFEDFAAEMEFGVWGKEAYTGIFWDAEPQKYNYPEEYQAAFSSPDYLTVKTDGTKTFGLGGAISSENNQLLRVERIGKKLRVSVNGRILFEQTLETAGKGKLGIYCAHRGGDEYPWSLNVGIKSFKVWK